jgi:diadenosine tetraphosphate (Ap4A) HIT family hydrolase
MAPFSTNARGSLHNSKASCAFGEIEAARLLAVDDLFAVVSGKFPISPGHTLIIARRPVARFQELTSAEKAEMLTN